MMNFNENNMAAKKVALHYAEKLNNELAKDVFQGKKEIEAKEDAIELTCFFWDMADEAADDLEKNTEVSAMYDLEFWMEKLMNMIIGYISRCGFKDYWTKESNRINGHN